MLLVPLIDGEVEVVPPLMRIKDDFFRELAGSGDSVPSDVMGKDATPDVS